MQDLPEAVSAEELSRYLDLKKLDERVCMFEAVSGYDGYVYIASLYPFKYLKIGLLLATLCLFFIH